MSRVRLRRCLVGWSVAIAVFLAMVVAAMPVSASDSVDRQGSPDDPVVLAHYYIWFEPTSWNRAKIDFPLLGRYSSDRESIMREHVRLAKSIGIDGFIVSWKSTEVLDPRLETLIEIAAEEDFSLAITYQALDFERNPLPVNRIEHDLDDFRAQYADNPVFDVFGKPLIVVTGTWEFSRDELAKITTGRRDDLFILASEKNLDGYQRVADLVDGDLYYWSSVNPDTFPGYPAKIAEMGAEVRANGGIWIAPAAPGFDAREVGGSSVVEREDGKTMRRQWNGAMASLPDAIGIISWNEFSENTHIEPSTNYGNTYTQVIAELTGSTIPETIVFDSSEPGGRTDDSTLSRVAPLAFLVALVAFFLLRMVRRSRRRRSQPDALPSETPAPGGPSGVSR